MRGVIGKQVKGPSTLYPNCWQGEQWDRESGQIVVGVDGSDNSYRALDWALAEARMRGASVLLVHALHVPVGVVPMFASPVRAYNELDQAAHEVLEQSLAHAHRRAPALSVEGVVTHGSPAAVLEQASRGAVLLVVGTRGHGALVGTFLGSVSSACVRHAMCPVVVVPHGDIAGRSSDSDTVDRATAPV